MTLRKALAFVRKHGIVLMSARGPVPSLARAVAGGPFRGSWWSHPQARLMYRVFQGVYDSDQVLVCRLIGGKVTFVHRRLWPSLVRLAGMFPSRGLAAIREEHTAKGRHRVRITPFPRWVPKPALDQARRMTRADAVAQWGADRLFAVSGRMQSGRGTRA